MKTLFYITSSEKTEGWFAVHKRSDKDEFLCDYPTEALARMKCEEKARTADREARVVYCMIVKGD